MTDSQSLKLPTKSYVRALALEHITHISIVATITVEGL